MKRLDLNNVDAMNYLCCNELEPALWLWSCCSRLASCYASPCGWRLVTSSMVLRWLVQVQMFNVGAGVQLCGNEEC
jgi:hypothetical protein